MARTKAQAVAMVDRHVQPRDCFDTFVGTREGWAPISGTGRAHDVAHQRNIRGGSRGNNACDLGYRPRVCELVQGSTEVAVADVQVNDIWANDNRDHCGMVVQVATAAEGNGPPRITIEHDSSRQGGVARNDWAGHFHGGGTFFR